MNNTQKIISNKEWIFLLLSTAALFGFFVRFFPTVQAGFPPNDGGMFLSMIVDLTQSRYILPEFTSYNQLKIPFAYPPFGFYAARLLSDIFQFSELNIIRFLPPLVNSISILVFYFLSSELLKSKSLGALSSAFYALTPGAFGWFVMGGGLTRSFGSLFLLLTVLATYQLFQTSEKKYIGFGIVWGGLAVLSHPEAGIHTAATCILLWIFFGRTRYSLIHAVYLGIGVLFFTSTWWLTVFNYHGLAPFVSALHTGSYGTPFLFAIYKAIVGDELLPVLAGLRILGLGWAVWKGQYFLIAWFFLPYIVEPRSAPSVAFYPLTMLIALAFAEGIPFLFSRLQKIEINIEELYKNKLYNFALFFLLIYLFVDCSLYGFRLIGNSLKPAEMEAMMWIKENTSSDLKFIALTGNPSPEIDPFIEWFPALTERRNQSTIQGYEWLLGEQFFERYSDLAELQKCDSVACVESWSESTELDYQYVVIAKTDSNENLLQSFDEMSSYTQIYNLGEIAIYER